jgi:hypothetical protein
VDRAGYARTYLDALVHNYRGRLSISLDANGDYAGWWTAHVEWETDDQTDGPIVGYTSMKQTQAAAVISLVETIIEHQVFKKEYRRRS